MLPICLNYHLPQLSSSSKQSSSKQSSIIGDEDDDVDGLRGAGREDGTKSLFILAHFSAGISIHTDLRDPNIHNTRVPGISIHTDFMDPNIHKISLHADLRDPNTHSRIPDNDDDISQ